MKVKLLVILLACIHQFNYSQTNKFLKGKVMSDNFLLQNVDVINKTTHASTTTDANGAFVLAAKVNDSILFYRKEYYLKGLKLSPNDMVTNTISVSMEKKPEELDEIIIRQTPNIDWAFDKKWEQEKRNQIALERAEKKIKNSGVYDGAIEKGIDFARIGKMIFKLFAKEKATNNILLPLREFKELATTSCDQKFYLETLKLKKEEIERFLDFCDADPKAKSLSQNPNVLLLMDFMYSKNIEFKKL